MSINQDSEEDYLDDEANYSNNFNAKMAVRKNKDKTDHSISEKVIDRQVRLVLYRLKNRMFLKSVQGCISTGKEANVYYGEGYENQEYAIKIYKSMVLDYKDRRRYMDGDYRLRNSKIGKTSASFLRKWAVKERRNLERLCRENIPAPQPRKLVDLILIMDFLGSDGLCYPSLKNFERQIDGYQHTLFVQAMLILKNMYLKCNLVHADYSEYNLLVNPLNKSQDGSIDPKLYVIDVSQAIEFRSPRAFEFLRADIDNTLKFFSRQNLQVPSLQISFDWIIDNDMSSEQFEKSLNRLLDYFESNPTDSTAADEAVSKIAPSNKNSYQNLLYHDDYVFKNVDIKQNLMEIDNYEKDIKAVNRGRPNEMFYAKATKLDETFLKNKKFKKVSSNIAHIKDDLLATILHESDEEEAGDELVETDSAATINDQINPMIVNSQMKPTDEAHSACKNNEIYQTCTINKVDQVYANKDSSTNNNSDDLTYKIKANPTYGNNEEQLSCEISHHASKSLLDENDPLDGDDDIDLAYSKEEIDLTNNLSDDENIGEDLLDGIDLTKKIETLTLSSERNIEAVQQRRMERKEHKNQVKLEKREKRENKMKKSQKQQLIKKTKRRR